MKPADRPLITMLGFRGYPFDLLLAVNASTANVIKVIQRRGYTVTDHDRTQLEMNTVGHSYILQSDLLVVRLASFDASPKAFALLAHELLHALIYMTTAIGLKLADESEEAFCYALQDVTEQSVRALIRYVGKK